MLQDIEPYQFNNEFREKEPRKDDYLLIFKGEEVLLETSSDALRIPTIGNLCQVKDLIYLFSISECAVYCSLSSVNETTKMQYKSVQSLRDLMTSWMVFTISTAQHLVKWYDSNRFCGKCGKQMTHSKKERALCCESCDITKYPNISPAVIVGIIDKDKLLMTRYADRPYKKLSLVAGFMEIGETLETTIQREVMEEVGLRVKNIRYFKSQPWAFSQSILVGFFADLDGSPEINLDSQELSEAVWLKREEIPVPESMLSLTSEMVEAFRNNTHTEKEQQKAII